MSASPTLLALVALFAPLVAALVLAVAAPLRRKGQPAAWISLAGAAVSLAAAALLLAGLVAEPSAATVTTWQWLPDQGKSLADVGVRVDGISASMLVVVTLVASAVQLFSVGYMAGETPPSFGRYFTYHSLFVFSMNLLVLAPNLLQLFAGWELVGLTSYLLIGFFYQKPSAARAAVKAFWLTKLADMGLLIGLILLVAWSGGFSWDARLSPEQLTVVTLLLFLAVMGKSAQFPLHVWLPDAMEGPTPVSALLHAATMVAAGVYLVVRANPLFAQAPTTLTLMAWVGAFTALFAAVVAVVQTDIKRVLAYSTCSQLGYMVCALGAGSLMGGFFHLTTHAFFKALLFLGAGSVIHAVHSNELGDMGGLFKKMRLTGTVFIVGALALAGVPGLAGFFSKDLILEAVAEKGLWIPFAALMAAAFLTALYMGRVIFLAFFGKPSEAAGHAHEGGPSMRIPLVVLAVGSLVTGFFGKALSALYGVPYAFHLSAVGIAATTLGLGGLLLAWLVYGKRSLPEARFASLAPIARLARSGAVDRAYQLAFQRGLLALAAVVGWFDRYVIDGLMNLVAWASLRAAGRLRRVQTGNVQDYVFAVLAGAVALVVWGLLS